MPKITVNSQEFEVSLTANFQLSAEVNGDHVSAKDEEGLKRAIAFKFRKERTVFDIKVIIRYGSQYDHSQRYVRATLRGLNSRTGAALMTVEGKNEQMSNPPLIAMSDAVSDAQLAVLNRLFEVECDAKRQHAEYLRPLQQQYLRADALVDSEAKKDVAA